MANLPALEPKDWISGAALIASGISLYVSSLRRAKLWVVPGDYVLLGYTRDGGAAVGSALTFGNRGARAGSVLSCGGTIRAVPHGEPVRIRWHHRYETKNIGTPGESVRMHNENVGWPEPILVSGKDVQTERLFFFGASRILRITERDAKFLGDETRPGDKMVAKKSLMLFYSPERDRYVRIDEAYNTRILTA